MLFVRWALAMLLACGLASSSACHKEGYDASKLPPELVPDYALFAQRCSKCHSLARPLNSGIDSDEYWAEYVERMRLQPGSGISVEDKTPILRFLHYYSLE